MSLRPHPKIQLETLQLSVAKAEEKGSPEKNALVLKRPSGKDMHITAITFLQTKQVMWPKLISKGQVSINVFCKRGIEYEWRVIHPIIHTLHPSYSASDLKSQSLVIEDILFIFA